MNAGPEQRGPDSELAGFAPPKPAPRLTPRALCLAGPTGSGKSAVALHLATELDGEIVSVDSMQVYRGLDLGTAKASPAERARVPHHLLDVAELGESFSAADFVRLAGAAEGTIRSRGRLPVFCGGTGLYFRAFFEGLREAPAPDPAARTALEATPLCELLAELERADPATFARIDRANPRRVIRAVEVLRLGGQVRSLPPAEWTRADATSPTAAATPLFVLVREPDDLRQRIELRVDAMFAAGLVAETQELLDRGLRDNRTALQAIGYRQVVEHLDGLRDLATTMSLVKQKTRQFARRQRTWFRHQPGAEFVAVPPHEAPAVTAGRILARFRTRSPGPV